jgi:hypothetical protein
VNFLTVATSSARDSKSGLMGKFASGKLPTDRKNNAELVKYTAGSPFWSGWPLATVVDGTLLKDSVEVLRTALFLVSLYTQARSYLAGEFSVLW